jgi:hypothetical protein
MQKGVKAEVVEAFGAYEPGDIVYIDEPPEGSGPVTVVPEPGSNDWQFMPTTFLKPADS